MGSWGCLGPSHQGCAQHPGRRRLAGYFAIQQELAGIRMSRSFLLELVGDKLRSFGFVKTGVTNLVPGEELIAHSKVMKRTTGSAIIT